MCDKQIAVFCVTHWVIADYCHNQNHVQLNYTISSRAIGRAPYEKEYFVTFDLLFRDIQFAFEYEHWQVAPSCIYLPFKSLFLNSTRWGQSTEVTDIQYQFTVDNLTSAGFGILCVFGKDFEQIKGDWKRSGHPRPLKLKRHEKFGYISGFQIRNRGSTRFY